MVEHRLGIQVVALLEHAHQYLVDRVEAACYAVGIIGLACLAQSGFHHDARLVQFVDKPLYEHVATADEQRREYRVVVVPAPSVAQCVGTLHGLVGVYVATYCVHSHFAYALHEGAHVVDVESWVESSHAVDVAVECAVAHIACIAKLCLEAIAAAQFVNCCYGCYHLHGRSRAHQLALVVGVYGRVGIEVVYHYSHLRCAEHVALKQSVDVCAHLFGPWQGVL